MSTSKVCVDCGTTFSFDIAPGRFAESLVRLRVRCPECETTRQAERQAVEDADAEKQRLETWHTRLSSSGLAPRLAGNEDLGLTGHVARAVREFGQGKIHGLLLTGPVGVGKTTIAARAFATRLWTRSGYWRSAPALLAGLNADHGTTLRTEALAVLTGQRMIGLDDLGEARATEYAAEQMFAAVDNAYTRRIPLVVTSNIDLMGLAKRWPNHGEQIASRLMEQCVWCQIDGQDRRRRAQLSTASQDPTQRSAA